MRENLIDNAGKLLNKHADIVTSKVIIIDRNIIDDAKSYLNLDLPKSYEDFIQIYGYISLGGNEIYGITSGDFINSGIPDAIWLTQQNRSDFNLPHHLIAIYDVGEGTTYCLDTSQMNVDNECPVVAWPIDGYAATPTLEIVAPDFGTFFLEMVKREISYKDETS